MGKQTLNQQIERHVVGKRTDGVVVSRVIWKTRSKYRPHQGKREIARLENNWKSQLAEVMK